MREGFWGETSRITFYLTYQNILSTETDIVSQSGVSTKNRAFGLKRKAGKSRDFRATD
jgi:hypothetical protein